MSSDKLPEPDQPSLLIYIGQDIGGRWLVQDSAKRVEGRFLSYAAAKNYADAECVIHQATMVAASVPLEPSICLARPIAETRALPCAA